MCIDYLQSTSIHSAQTRPTPPLGLGLAMNGCIPALPSPMYLVDQLWMLVQQMTMHLSTAMAEIEREEITTKTVCSRYSIVHYSTVQHSTVQYLERVLQVAEQRGGAPVPALVHHLHLHSPAEVTVTRHQEE